MDTPRIRGLSANLLYIWGRDENFFEWSSADIVFVTLGVQWRPTERLRLDFNHNLQSFGAVPTDRWSGSARMSRMKVEYQATRAIFLRYVGEYATNYQDTLRDDSRTGLPLVFVRPDGTFSAATGFRQRTWRNDWLFLVSADTRDGQSSPDMATRCRIRRPARIAAAPHARRLFLEVSYLFRL